MKRDGNRTVIITGGSKGIGASISNVFSKEGYHVIIGARNDNGIVKKIGGKLIFQKIDVKNKKDHKLLVKIALDVTGRLDAYINCAGFSEWKSLGDISEGFLDEMLDINLKGVFWGCQAAASAMKKGGSIVNISSLAGKRGSANNSVYCASKFAVNGITQALAKELGPKGIRINALCPVYVKTEGLLEALKYKESPAGGKNINTYLKNFALENTAMGRLPTAMEVARACLFLASEDASAITGQCINIDCGVLPQ